MKNNLVCIKDADEMVVIPGHRVRFILATSATNIEISYAGDDNGIGTADITCTSGKADEVIKLLCKLSAQSTGLVTIGAQIAGTYINEDITAVAAVAISA